MLLVVECAPEMVTIPTESAFVRTDMYEHKRHYLSHADVLPALTATLTGNELVLTSNSSIWHIAVELSMPVRVVVESRNHDEDRGRLLSQAGMRVLSAEELDLTIDWEDSVEWQTLFVDGILSSSVVTDLCDRLCGFFDGLQTSSRSPVELRVDNNLGLFEFSSFIKSRTDRQGWRWIALLKECNDEVVSIVSWNGSPYGDLPGATE